MNVKGLTKPERRKRAVNAEAFHVQFLKGYVGIVGATVFLGAESSSCNTAAVTAVAVVEAAVGVLQVLC